MLRCVLVDDDLNGLEYLRLLCERLPDVEVVKCYNDPRRFLLEQAGLDHDLLLLDIDMPGMDGLELARLQQGRPVIFTTGHERYAADAFDVNALDFIRKPIARERLEVALSKAREHLQRQQQPQRSGMLTVTTDRGRTMVRTTDIRWTTTPDQEKRDKLIHLADGTVLRVKNITMEQLLELLPSTAFARINRSDIVALEAVHLVTDDTVHLKTSTPGSEAVRRHLGQAFSTHFLHGLARWTAYDSPSDRR